MGAYAQLAVSANDNKSTNAEGRTVVIENARPTPSPSSISAFPRPK
jgi:hypothetical protein